MSVARRYGHYHGGAKGRLVAQQVKPAPAWQARNIPPAVNGRPASGQGAPTGDGGRGSKVLLSNFPQDVDDVEIIELMRKTVGPVDTKNTMMFTDPRGKPLGIGIMAFMRSNDAVRARRLYNGKIIDGKRTIKLELILDGEPGAVPSLFDPKEPSRPTQNKPRLINRMGKAAPNGVVPLQSTVSSGSKSQPKLGKHVVSPPSAGIISVAKRRTKKGAKRVRKVVSKMDLDAEMDAYQANGTAAVQVGA